MRTFWALLVLMIPTVLIYTQFLGNPEVFDDITFFHSEDYGYSYLSTLSVRWIPLTSFLWTRQLLGDAIIWLRLGNLLLHLATTVTLFLFLRRLFSLVIPEHTDNKTLSAFWLAFFAALIFSLHPVAVYAVGYLIQRTTLMATLFALLTWRCFLEGLVRDQRLWLYLSVLCYFFAGLSKENAITTPAVTLLLLFLLNPEPLQRIKQLYITFILYGVVALFIVVQIKNKHFLGQAYEPIASELLSRLSETLNPALVYPLSILTQAFTFFKYFWVWLVPSPILMSVDTCQTFASQLWSFPQTLGLVGFVVYGFVALRLLLQRGLTGLLGFALLCPWLLFFTEFATVRIQEIFVLYRSYLWMAGLFAGLPFICQKLTAKPAAILLSGVALLMMPLTWARLETFSHPLLLWDDAARRITDDKSCPTMDRILNNRAVQLIKLERYNEAIDDLTRSLKAVKQQKEPMISELANNYYNRGIAYLKTKQYQLAVNDFNTIVGTVPKSWFLFYFHKAQALEGLHELVAARQFYEQACLTGLKEGCTKQQELEALVK
jgi:protein O-mannosyl-transferase